MWAMLMSMTDVIYHPISQNPVGEFSFLLHLQLLFTLYLTWPFDHPIGRLSAVFCRNPGISAALSERSGASFRLSDPFRGISSEMSLKTSDYAEKEHWWETNWFIEKDRCAGYERVFVSKAALPTSVLTFFDPRSLNSVFAAEREVRRFRLLQARPSGWHT